MQSRAHSSRFLQKAAMKKVLSRQSRLFLPTNSAKRRKLKFLRLLSSAQRIMIVCSSASLQKIRAKAHTTAISSISAHVLHLKQPVLQRATTQSASSLMMRLREKLSRHSKSAALNLSFSVAQASTMLIFRQLKNAALPLSVFRLIHRTQLPSMQSPSSHALTEDFTRLFRRSRTTTSHSADFSAWTFTTKLPVSWAQVRSDSAWQESARDSA